MARAGAWSVLAVSAAGAPFPRVRRAEGVRACAQNPEHMIVLGIDPGTANTGYGVVATPPRRAAWSRSTAA